MGGRAVFPPDPVLSAASPPGRSRPVAPASSVARVSSPSFLSVCRAGFASTCCVPPPVGCSAGAQRDFRPRGPCAAVPAAPSPPAPPAPPPLPPPPPATAARAASAATLET
eukprot:5897060-Pleurochrysis_carterae.AAC.1